MMNFTTRCFKAKQMFDGELASLHAIESTNTIRVPKPILVSLFDTFVIQIRNRRHWQVRNHHTHASLPNMCQ
jgi:fructosamine-3-kinase